MGGTVRLGVFLQRAPQATKEVPCCVCVTSYLRMYQDSSRAVKAQDRQTPPRFSLVWQLSPSCTLLFCCFLVYFVLFLTGASKSSFSLVFATKRSSYLRIWYSDIHSGAPASHYCSQAFACDSTLFIRRHTIAFCITENSPIATAYSCSLRTRNLASDECRLKQWRPNSCAHWHPSSHPRLRLLLRLQLALHASAFEVCTMWTIGVSPTLCCTAVYNAKRRNFLFEKKKTTTTAAQQGTLLISYATVYRC